MTFCKECILLTDMIDDLLHERNNVYHHFHLRHQTDSLTVGEVVGGQVTARVGNDVGVEESS